MAIDNM